MTKTASKSRKPRAKALQAANERTVGKVVVNEHGDYVRASALAGVREEGAELNDIGCDLSRLRSLMRVIERGLESLPCDMLVDSLSGMTSGELANLATIALGFLDGVIGDMDKLRT